jgi:hypothetical protein
MEISNDAATPDSYEVRCGKLADSFAKSLGAKVKTDDIDDLTKLSSKIQAEVNLADYKLKFRQADHSKWFLHTPLWVSIATFVLALVLAFITAYQALHEHETQAKLVLEVLEAPPEKGEKLLQFFEENKLLNLNAAEHVKLEKLLR